MRQRLPNRRLNATRKITWTTYGGNERTILVTFGFREMLDASDPTALIGVSASVTYRVAEVFCADFKAGSDTLGIVTDTCILISRLFQLGESPKALLSTMCEPYSLIGTILHAACEEEAVMQERSCSSTEASSALRDIHLKPLYLPPRPWWWWLFGSSRRPVS
jgi:hypothetical protein